MFNLPRHLRIGLQIGGVMALVFAAFIVYALRTAPRMARQSGATLDAFYRACQAHSYARAYALLAPELREALPQAEMIARWQKFERQNGAIQKWTPAAGGSIFTGGRVCLLPPFVDYTHRILGQKPSDLASATVVYVRMVPRDGGWRLQKFNFMR